MTVGDMAGLLDTRLRGYDELYGGAVGRIELFNPT